MHMEPTNIYFNFGFAASSKMENNHTLPVCDLSEYSFIHVLSHSCETLVASQVQQKNLQKVGPMISFIQELELMLQATASFKAHV